MTSTPRDPYGWLTVTDLQLVARTHHGARAHHET